MKWLTEEMEQIEDDFELVSLEDTRTPTRENVKWESKDGVVSLLSDEDAWFSQAMQALKTDDTMYHTSSSPCALCDHLSAQLTLLPVCGHAICDDCAFLWLPDDCNDCPLCVSRMPLTPSYVCCSRCLAYVDCNMITIHHQWCTATPPPPTDTAKFDLLATTTLTSRAFFSEFVMAPLPPDVQTMRCTILAVKNEYRLFVDETLLCVATQYFELDRRVTYSFFTDTDVCVARVKRNHIGSEYSFATYATGETDRALGAVQYGLTYEGSGRQMLVALPFVQQTEFGAWEICAFDGDDKTMVGQVDALESTQAMHLLNKPRQDAPPMEVDPWEMGMDMTESEFDAFVSSTQDQPMKEEGDDASPPTAPTRTVFELVTCTDMDSPVMEFGFAGIHRDEFMREYFVQLKHPLSPFQAFALALSRLESTLGEGDVF
ncbi:Aste57867_24390 [Aphanomyces stellatus]|uniref:Aste57867_24390 protein n=1 Tax=Aphanomyces stellatus TaxID=120398 RepID=A0A485LQB0_9STRA|nr:hypothetical protein As57867_024314 [Aphanomyces stellatus]VFU01030.1 Aste57867_24390 [Aphanomyces stellatus]